MVEVCTKLCPESWSKFCISKYCTKLLSKRTLGQSSVIPNFGETLVQISYQSLYIATFCQNVGQTLAYRTLAKVLSDRSLVPSLVKVWVYVLSGPSVRNLGKYLVRSLVQTLYQIRAVYAHSVGGIKVWMEVWLSQSLYQCLARIWCEVQSKFVPNFGPNFAPAKVWCKFWWCQSLVQI